MHCTRFIWHADQSIEMDRLSVNEFGIYLAESHHIVSVLGQDKGYTVKYKSLPEGVPKGEARGNS